MLPEEKKLKLAFFTPLHPVKSGISDYSEELLPDLAQFADVDVIIEKGYTPSNQSLRSYCGIRTDAEFRKDPGKYDIPIYQVANSYDHHGYILASMEQCPGILVLHDFCLQYLVFGLTLRAGRFRSLVEVLRPKYGDGAASLARKLQFAIEDPNLYSFARPFIERSRAVIVNSEAAAHAVRQECPDKLVRVIHMAVPIPEITKSDIRSRFGLNADDFVVGSVSTLSYTKQVGKVLESFRVFRARHKSAKFLIVGGGSMGEASRKFIAERGLQDAVVATGWVSNEDYRDLIATCDVVVDIRYPSGTESSASHMRAVAAGCPSIVSDQGTFRELPDTICRKVSVERDEVAQVSQHLEDLFQNPEERKRMSEATRQWAVENIKLSVTARRYVEFASEVISRPDTLVPPGPMFAAEDEKKISDELLYKAARVTYLYRKYGVRDTVRRVVEEVTRKS